MIDTKFLLFVLLIGLTGWSSWYLFFATSESKGSTYRQYFVIFLSGFAVFSVCLFLLTFLGWFHWQVLLVITGGLFVTHVWKLRGVHPHPWVKFSSYLLACFLLGLMSLGLARVDKPFEAILWADDASVFIGAASRLAQSGNLIYTDPLIQEMSPHERSELLNNRIPNDQTGNLIRFPGGVRLINPSSGKVGFSFYHLLPAWLALGIQVLGNPGYLLLLSLFSILTLTSLYFLGESLGGSWLGAFLVCVFFLFYPQSYFSKMPATEILSQLLLLSGLLVFATAQKSPSMTSREQVLIGIIWGSLVLCRLESIYVLGISIILVFSLVPFFSRNQKEWRPLILTLTLFGLLAIYYQILRHEYLYALTSSQISSNGALVMLGIELLDFANNFTDRYLMLSHILFVGTCVFLVMSLNWIRKKEFRVWPYWLKAISGLVLCGILLVQILEHATSWWRLMTNVEWVSIYFTSGILLILFLGLIAFTTFLIWKERTNAFLWVILILFLVPAVSYLLNPLIPRDQPWGIRRFVPVAFPLFFLLSFTGWWVLFRKLIRSNFARKSAFLFLVFFVSASFYTMSRNLMRDSIYEGLSAQMRQFSRTIPPKALVILPESWAGIHLEMPLQYMEGFDTLLLPLDRPLRPGLAKTIGSYLSRISQRRPIVAMLNSTKDPPQLLRRLFDLKIQESQLIQFKMIPRTRSLVFPERSELASIPCALYALSPTKKTFEKSVLLYNEPNVTFVDFYDKEKGFRWTNHKSTIKDFSYTTQNKTVSAILSTIPEYSFYDRRKLELSLVINGILALKPLKEENGNYHFDIDGRTIPKIMSVTIESNTFRPVDHHVNTDSRDLGVSFVELSFRRK